MLLGGMDPRPFGLDPKMFGAPSAGASAAASPSANTTFSGLDPKMSPGVDPKLLQSMDPKMLASMGLDAKSLSAAMDPKNIAKSMTMDPKMVGMDPKMLASMGIDPKMMASMGLDGKGGMDPKMLAGIDPKLLGGMDPKMLQSMGMDPKMMSDPNLMAMYAMGMPGMMPPMTSGASMTNGIGSSGTPLPSSKGNLTAKPKPGTVAAALQEKKDRPCQALYKGRTL